MAQLTVDPVNFTDTTAWALLITTAYDKAVEFKRWELPLFKQFFNKKVVSPTNDSNTFVFTLHNNLSTSLTPLTEQTSPSALAVQAPTRVSVSVAEYGAYLVDTVKLETVAFTQPDQEVVTLLARQQGDTLDKLAVNVVDASTNVKRSGNRATTVTVTATDTFNSALVRNARTNMDRNLNMPLGGGSEFVIVAHPDTLYDLKSESGTNVWSTPHIYQDTSNIYSGEVGSYMGMRFVQSTRATIQTGAGASGANVYNSYVFADQAVAEVELIPPTTVLGPQVDPLRRFNTIGWKTMWGAALFRPEALLRLESATSYS
jgi:N4-gp56 family major capsid protein